VSLIGAVVRVLTYDDGFDGVERSMARPDAVSKPQNSSRRDNSSSA